jgi:hypothetical protein
VDTKLLSGIHGQPNNGPYKRKPCSSNIHHVCWAARTHSAPPEYPYFPKFIQGPDVCASLTESRNGKGSFNKAAAVRPPKARLFTLHRAIIHAYTTLAQDCKSDRRKIQRADNCATNSENIWNREKYPEIFWVLFPPLLLPSSVSCLPSVHVGVQGSLYMCHVSTFLSPSRPLVSYAEGHLVSHP